MSAEGQRPPSRPTHNSAPSRSSIFHSKKLTKKKRFTQLKRSKKTLNLLFLLGYPIYYLLLSVFRFLHLLARLLPALFSSLHLPKLPSLRLRLTTPRLKLSKLLPPPPSPLEIFTTRFLKKARRSKQSSPSFLKFTFPTFTLPKFSLRLPPTRFPHLPRLPLILFLFLFSLGSLTSFFYFWILVGLPSPKQLTSNRPNLTTLILDRHGQVLYRLYTDENRQLVDHTKLPAYVSQSIIAIEDKHFFDHQGISLEGIIRAFSRNFSSTSDSLQGGSTITQQLVKTTLLSREKTLRRKLKEVVLALHTELLYTKDQILGLYLNQINFGGTAYGIQSAAQQYFGIDAKDLNLAQAALLAGLPQSPTRYSPFGASPQLALDRQKQVLGRMYEDGYITKEQLQAALATPLRYANPKPSILAPHFVMYVRDYLVKNYDESLVNHGGLTVTTTLDLGIQQLAQDALNSELANLRSLNVTNAAVLVTDPKTGQILAMVGSRDYFDTKNDGQVNLTTALRQPGSSVKPFNYALAFENGLSPSQTIDDSPITFSTPGSPPWSPKNYDGRYHGTVTLRTALASSYNVPAVKLLARNGVQQFVALATSLGISSWNDPHRFGLSMTLGSNEVKMTDMATAYSAFPNLGTPVPLNPLLKVQNKDSKTLSLPPCAQEPTPQTNPLSVNAAENPCPIRRRVLSPKTAYIINDILSDPLARAPAFGTRSVLNIPGATVAVKTGTSNDLRDNWTFGYTPKYLVSVWVGNNDNSPMSAVASGITGASPIWSKIITALTADQPNLAFTLPEDLTKVTICGLTKTLTCPACPNPYLEVFTKGSEPKSTCTDTQVAKILEEKQKQQPQALLDPKILDAASTSR